MTDIMNYGESNNIVENTFLFFLNTIINESNANQLSIDSFPPDIKDTLIYLEEFGIDFSDFDKKSPFLSQYYRISQRKFLGVYSSNIKDRISQIIQYTPDVQQRRKKWSEISEKAKLDETIVNITNDGILIREVGFFELEDDDDNKNSKQQETSPFTSCIPPRKVWSILSSIFNKIWCLEDRRAFLEEVMKMKIPKNKSEEVFYKSLDSVDFKKFIWLVISYDSGIWLGERKDSATNTFIGNTFTRRVKTVQYSSSK